MSEKSPTLRLARAALKEITFLLSLITGQCDVLRHSNYGVRSILFSFEI